MHCYVDSAVPWKQQSWPRAISFPLL